MKEIYWENKKPRNAGEMLFLTHLRGWGEGDLLTKMRQANDLIYSI